MARQVCRNPGVIALAWVAVVSACAPAATPTGTPGGQSPIPVATRTAAPATPRITDSPPPALELLWEKTGDTEPSGAEPQTYSPAVDPLTGDIWVALSFDSVIWTFAADGTYKGSFGRPGSGDGEFNFVRPTCPCGAGALAFAPDGSLFVADVGNQRVQKFDPAHEFVTAWGDFGAGEGQFADITQIATDGKAVYVTDDARRDIQVFDTSGTYQRTIAPAGWLAVDPGGNLYVGSDGGVTKYDPSGKAAATYSLPHLDGADQIGIAAHPDGRLFVNYQRQQPPYIGLGIGEFDTGTEAYRFWSNGGETLALDPSGEALYVANFTNPEWPRATLRKYAVPVP